MAKIQQITARKILDSRSNPTIEVTVVLNDGTTGVASCPSGKSVGSYEAVSLETQLAIANVQNIIAPKLVGTEAPEQNKIDEIMIVLDGTENKQTLGANAMLSVSMAVCKAGAKNLGLELFDYIKQLAGNSRPKMPIPVFNILNGGKHGGENVDFQEFMVISTQQKNIDEALNSSKRVYDTLGQTIKGRKLSTTIGDEGGFAPQLSNNNEAFSLIRDALERSETKASMGIDAAANSFYKNDQYYLKDKPNPLSTTELILYYSQLQNKYNLSYLEDPLAEDDWDGWANITSRLSSSTLIVGDDLITTNPHRLQLAIDKKAVSGVIIKPNQIGTVTETLNVVKKAQNAGFKIVVSHRSGETDDTFIADFAVGVLADFVKFGPLVQKERIAKYDRLLEIEKWLI